MMSTLNMNIETVRVVLKNEVNDIIVCRSTQEVPNQLYTMISIKSDYHRKYFAEKISKGEIFGHCREFMGSFSIGSQLRLLFRYENENRIGNVKSIYLFDFIHCKTAAINLLGALAEAGVTGETGKLLLNERNINIDKNGEVSLNYFLDFKEYDFDGEGEEYMETLGNFVSTILEYPWKDKLNEDYNSYPDELKLFRMKTRNQSLSSYGQVIAQIRSMPDKLTARQGIMWRLRKLVVGTKGVLFRNPTRTILTLLVMVTIIYAAYQIGIRIQVRRAYADNVSYNALDYIGKVYLGNEE